MAATAVGCATRSGSCCWWQYWGILSGCRSSRDLEAFAPRHREALNESLGLNFKRWPSDATFLYLFNKAHLQEFGQVLQAWIISQIPDGAEGLEQLVCDGKTLKSTGDIFPDGGGSAPPVTASKDDAPAAVQAAIHNLAGLGSSSVGGGLIQTTSG